MVNNKSYYIFDFDGTLVNSLGVMMDICNSLAEKFHFRKVEEHEIDIVRNLSSKELIKYFAVPIYKIPSLIYHARKLFRNQLTTLPPFNNLPTILKDLHNAGIALGIVTSNSAQNVSTWLQQHQLDQYFNFIHTESSYLGKKKILKKVIKLYQIDKSKAVYVGDETRDIDAAKQNNLCSVAVTWGFNSEEVLLRHEPNFVARVPEDLLGL